MSEHSRARTDLHALIRKLDALCRPQGGDQDHDAPPPDTWAAVLFRVRTQSFLTPLEQVAEVLELPGEITRVPGTKPWLLGVANNRGTLLPIFDLATLIQGGLPSSRADDRESGQERRRDRARDSRRVLVVRQPELPCGLVVSETIGMRHVKLDGRVETMPDGLGASAPYVEDCFLVDGTLVPVLRLDRLMADPLLNAAMG